MGRWTKQRDLRQREGQQVKASKRRAKEERQLQRARDYDERMERLAQRTALSRSALERIDELRKDTAAKLDKINGEFRRKLEDAEEERTTKRREAWADFNERKETILKAARRKQQKAA